MITDKNDDGSDKKDENGDVVTIGKYEGDKTISASATHQIGGLDTESYESIFFETENRAGVPVKAVNGNATLDKFGSDIATGFGDFIEHSSAFVPANEDSQTLIRYVFDKEKCIPRHFRK